MKLIYITTYARKLFFVTGLASVAQFYISKGSWVVKEADSVQAECSVQLFLVAHHAALSCLLAQCLKNITASIMYPICLRVKFWCLVAIRE